MIPQWITDLVPVAPWAAGVLAVGYVVWKIAPIVRKWARFIDRVTGVPADPKTGQQEVLGLFERIDNQDELLETIKHELFPNSGKSLRDQTNRLEQTMGAHLASCAPAGQNVTVTLAPPAEAKEQHND